MRVALLCCFCLLLRGGVVVGSECNDTQSSEGQVLLQSRRHNLHKSDVAEETMMGADLWPQVGGDKQKCSGSFFDLVGSQAACQELATERGHFYYEFLEPDKCSTAETCQNPLDSNEDWKIFGTNLWEEWGDPGRTCDPTNVGSKVTNLLTCQELAVARRHDYYTYRLKSQKCATTPTCTFKKASMVYTAKSPVHLGGATPAPTPWMVVDGFTSLGLGQCKGVSYQSGLGSDEAKTLEMCADVCRQEWQCHYFSFQQNALCYRFMSDDVGDCSNREYMWRTELGSFAKNRPATPGPTPLPPPSKDWSEKDALIVMAKLYALQASQGKLRQEFAPKFECYGEHPESKWHNQTFVPCSYLCSKPVNNRGCSGQYLIGGDPRLYYKTLGVEVESNFALWLRLGFHSCFKNEDGSGGCNGCMNLEKVFVRWDGFFATSEKQDAEIARNLRVPKRPFDSIAANSNLALQGDLLERLYTEPNFPPMGPTMPRSLKDSGKSRADLWAFTATVAAHKGFWLNDKACDEGIAIYSQDKMPQEFECKITTRRPLDFYTGRTDCTDTPTLWKCEDYCQADNADIVNLCNEDYENCGGCANCPRIETWGEMKHRPRAYENMKKESHPSDWWNGTFLANFFEKDFGMNKRETVAIMGAHGQGHFHGEVSGGYRYDWVHLQGNQLNNVYYRVLAALPGKHYSLREDTDPHPHTPKSHAWVTGEGSNRIARTGWIFSFFETQVGRGPFQWFHQYERCITCRDGKNVDRHYYLWQKDGHDYGHRCCELCAKAGHITGVRYQHPKPVHWVYQAENLNEEELEYFGKWGCMRNLSVHENFLQVDMASAWEIPVDTSTGYPAGVPGIDDLDRPRPWVQLNKNNLVDEASGKTMFEIVEEYANDNNGWASDFIDALEKMLTNGVDTSQLKKAFTFDNVKCTQGVTDQEFALKYPHTYGTRADQAFKCEKVQ